MSSFFLTLQHKVISTKFVEIQARLHWANAEALGMDEKKYLQRLLLQFQILSLLQSRTLHLSLHSNAADNFLLASHLDQVSRKGNL